ncbi:MAG: MbnH family di-heme enzyme [Myxococcota bacterium]
MKTTFRFGRVAGLAALLGATGVVLAGGCGGDDEKQYAWNWTLPEGFPRPNVPADNPMTEAKVTLGRHLFYEPRLSGNETQSCASCHKQELAFTDGLAQSVGSTGEIHPRNSMSLVNVAYAASLNWANPLVRDLRDQALTPMFGDAPVELGLDETQLRERLESDPGYERLFREAYPEAEEWFTLDQVLKALATFQRSIVSADSAFDRYINGDRDAMSASARNGLELFFSERLECFHCHGGFHLSSSIDHEGNVFDQAVFFNNGLYNIDGNGAYPAHNTGLHAMSGNAGDMGKFRPPSLRNVALTAPYMHDGSIETLDGVLDHYAAGGRVIEDGPHAGDGRQNPYKNGFIAGFSLTPQERADVLAFLEALTDPRVVTEPAWSDPGPPEP